MGFAIDTPRAIMDTTVTFLLANHLRDEIDAAREQKEAMEAEHNKLKKRCINFVTLNFLTKLKKDMDCSDLDIDEDRCRHLRAEIEVFSSLIGELIETSNTLNQLIRAENNIYINNATRHLLVDHNVILLMIDYFEDELAVMMAKQTVMSETMTSLNYHVTKWANKGIKLLRGYQEKIDQFMIDFWQNKTECLSIKDTIDNLYTLTK